MEFVNQIISFFTPYLGEYARYVPIVLGTLMALIAFYIRRGYTKKIGTEIKEAHKKDSENSNDDTSSLPAEQNLPAEASMEKLDLLRTIQVLRPSTRIKRKSPSRLSKRLIKPQLKTAIQPIVAEKTEVVAGKPEVVVEKTEGLSWSQRIKAGFISNS